MASQKTERQYGLGYSMGIKTKDKDSLTTFCRLQWKQ